MFNLELGSGELRLQFTIIDGFNSIQTVLPITNRKLFLPQPQEDEVIAHLYSL